MDESKGMRRMLVIFCAVTALALILSAFVFRVEMQAQSMPTDSASTTQCLATTKAGSQCSRMAVEGMDLCRQHSKILCIWYVFDNEGTYYTGCGEENSEIPSDGKCNDCGLRVQVFKKILSSSRQE